jgi:peptidoglycan/LPS O-acetylase OafA/YrhL
MAVSASSNGEGQPGLLATNHTRAASLSSAPQGAGQSATTESHDRVSESDSARKPPKVRSQTKHQTQIIGLDIIRCVAALYVMLYHYGCWIWAGNYFPGVFSAQDHWMAPCSWAGWVGVEIFFVLSGFVISYSAQNNTANGFAKNRVIRLYPTAWICTSITFVTAGLFEGSQYWSSSLRALAHTIAIAPWTTNWIDAPFWTLAVEISFYFIIFLLLASGLYERLGVVMMTLGGSTSILAVYRCGIVAGLYSGGHTGARIMAVTQNQRYFFLLFDHGMFFALGSIIWLCLLRGVTPSRLIGAAVSAVGCLAEIYVHCRLFVTDAEHLGLTVIEGNRCHAFLPITIWVLAILAIIYSVSYERRISALVGFKGARVIRTLGLMTYPMYLVHQKAGFEIIRFLHRRISYSVSVFLTGSLMILVSFIIVRFLERPLQNVFKSVLGVANKQDAIVAAAQSALDAQGSVKRKSA